MKRKMTLDEKERIHDKRNLILTKLNNAEHNLDKILLNLDSYYFKIDVDILLESFKNFSKKIDLHALIIDSNVKSIISSLDKLEETFDSGINVINSKIKGNSDFKLTGITGILSKIEEITDQVKKIRHTRLN